MRDDTKNVTKVMGDTCIAPESSGAEELSIRVVEEPSCAEDRVEVASEESGKLELTSPELLLGSAEVMLALVVDEVELVVDGLWVVVEVVEAVVDG